MYNKKLTIALTLAFVFLLILPIFRALAADRDCDTNAVIYCGALTKSELRTKLTNGTVKTYQSGAELQKLFNYYGFDFSHIDTLSEGIVTKDGKVMVGTKTVASNVLSMGRSYISGSTKITAFSYPLYLRPPSVSFVSSSIPAFVRLNPDGTMRYAIIKSCGNIVPGAAYKEPTYNLTVNKFEDLNRDGVKNTNEPVLSGWTFDISGNNFNAAVTTATNGSAQKSGLLAGTYRIAEREQTGWEATTGATKSVTITNSNQTIWFGNVKKVTIKETVTIKIAKYLDENKNLIKDESEIMLPGWEFKISGPNNYETTVTTDDKGFAELSGLNPGSYIVTEILKDGWENTTGLSMERVVTTEEKTQSFVFGNVEATKTPETPKGGGETKKFLPTSGPVETAAMVFSSFSIPGALLAWAKSKKRFKFSFRK
jgi:hypothetical protein